MPNESNIHPNNAGVQGQSFNNLLGFRDLIGVQQEKLDRNNTVPQIVIRYGKFTGTWQPNLPSGQLQLAEIDIGGGYRIWAHSLESGLAQDDRVILITWGVAQAVVLGKLVVI